MMKTECPIAIAGVPQAAHFGVGICADPKCTILHLIAWDADNRPLAVIGLNEETAKNLSLFLRSESTVTGELDADKNEWSGLRRT